MPSSKFEARYDTVTEIDSAQDMGHESDTTAYSDSLSKTNINKNPARRSRSRCQRLAWLRWVVVMFLQSAILLLLVCLYKKEEIRGASWDVETGGDINGVFVSKSHSLRRLTPEQKTYIPDFSSDANKAEIRKNWDDLMPLGSGTVEIKDWKNYPLLGKPIDDDPIRSGSIYEASWTHSLHCLYSTMDMYHSLVAHGRSNTTINEAHAAHCFEYLRMGILCSMDMTLEGSTSSVENSGQGQLHQCRDRSEVVKWIEARRVDDIKDIGA